MAMTARGSVLVGASGEAYVLYQLYRRDLLAAPAPSGAPIADLIVFDPKMSVGSMIQVKTSTRPNSWVLTTKNTRRENVHPRLFYALVHLAPASPTVFIVPSKVIAEVLTVSYEAWQTTLDRHGRPRGDSAIRGLMRRYPFDVPGYPAGWLDPYLDRWDYLTAEPETIAGLLA
jgi:hypothetical protein